jgi:hypothetical protein
MQQGCNRAATELRTATVTATYRRRISRTIERFDLHIKPHIAARPCLALARTSSAVEGGRDARPIGAGRPPAVPLSQDGSRFHTLPH